MNSIRNSFSSINQIQDEYLRGNTPKQDQLADNAKSFDDILKSKASINEVSDLKFSKHANLRLEERDITLSVNQKDRLLDGVAKASEKGIKESLVLVDELAFIVNIPNNTVVTAMDSTETNSNIFTNIDGAVIN